MAMRCPICGAKLMAKQICPYCKVTDEQILGASNRKVKQYRKTGNKDMICYTNVIPKDLSRLKIILYTIFFGYIGVNHYYVLRYSRATYSLISTVGSLSIMLIGFALTNAQPSFWMTLYKILYDVLFFMQAINIIMWLGDVLGVIFKSFKVPVVLPTKKQASHD